MQTARRITKCNHDSSAAFGWAGRMHTEDQTHISTFMYLYLKELVFWVICICTGQSGGVQEGIQGAENVWLAFLQGRVEHPSSARWQNLAHFMNMFFLHFSLLCFCFKVYFIQPVYIGWVFLHHWAYTGNVLRLYSSWCNVGSYKQWSPRTSILELTCFMGCLINSQTYHTRHIYANRLTHQGQ